MANDKNNKTATPATEATATNKAAAAPRLSDDEWFKRELEYVARFVDYKTAIEIAKRNAKNRDAVDALRAR